MSDLENNRWGLILDLSETVLHEAGIRNIDLYAALAVRLRQTIVDFIDSLDGDDDTQEAKIDARDRARACNGER